MLSKFPKIFLLVSTIGGAIAGCVSTDNRTPIVETVAVPSSTASAETPFVQVTLFQPAVNEKMSSPTPEVTAIVTETVEVKNDFEAINKNIDDYLNGNLNYWGPNREYMFNLEVEKREVAVGDTNISHLRVGGDWGIAYSISTVAVLLGRFDNGEKNYLVLGSEKNGQKLVWLLHFGMVDGKRYPVLGQVRIDYLSGKNPTFHPPKVGGKLVYHDELVGRLDDIVGRPISVEVYLNNENKQSKENPDHGALNEEEYVLYWDQMLLYDFSLLGDWLLGSGGDFGEMKKQGYVVSKLNQENIESIVAPISIQAGIPIIR